MSSFLCTHPKNDSEPNPPGIGHGLLDYSAYPHLIDAIAKFADHNTRLALRQTCKSLRNVTDALFPEGEQAMLVIGSREPGSGPEDSIKHVLPNRRLVKHRIPTLYTLRDLDAASLPAGYDMTQSELCEARLKAMARASGFMLSRDFFSYQHMSDGTPNTLEELTNFGRRNIGRSIPLLRIRYCRPPTTMLFHDIQTLVISTTTLMDDYGWPEALVRIENVAKVVLTILYSPSGLELGTPWPGPVHFKSLPQDTPPKFAIVFTVFHWSRVAPAPPVNLWPGVPLGWLHDLVQEIIRNCYEVTFVDALEIPPGMLGFDDQELSGDNYKDAIVETACCMVDRCWSDLDDTTKHNWTREIAKTAIRNIKFYTGDEYRQAVGVEQYDLEAK